MAVNLLSADGFCTDIQASYVVTQQKFVGAFFNCFLRLFTSFKRVSSAPVYYIKKCFPQHVQF